MCMQVVVVACDEAAMPSVAADATGFLTPEIAGATRVSQVIPVGASGFSEVEIRAVAAGPEVRGDVLFELREVRRDWIGPVVRSLTHPAWEVIAGPTYRFWFVPIRGSAGRRYRLDVRLPGTERGYGVRLWAADGRHTDGGTLMINDEEGYSDLVFSTAAARPTAWSRVAYRFRSTRGRLPGPVLTASLLALANVALLGALLAVARAVPERSRPAGQA